MPRLTYEEFKESYKNSAFHSPKWERLLQIGAVEFDFYRLMFELRLRVPDACGYWARGTWSWPWNWYRKYYEVRVKGNTL